MSCQLSSWTRRRAGLRALRATPAARSRRRVAPRTAALTPPAPPLIRRALGEAYAAYWQRLPCKLPGTGIVQGALKLARSLSGSPLCSCSLGLHALTGAAPCPGRTRRARRSRRASRASVRATRRRRWSCSRRRWSCPAMVPSACRAPCASTGAPPGCRMGMNGCRPGILSVSLHKDGSTRGEGVGGYVLGLPIWPMPPSACWTLGRRRLCNPQKKCMT